MNAISISTRFWIIAPAALVLMSLGVSAREPVLRVLQDSPSTTNCLRNAGFEQTSNGVFQHWQMAPNGGQVAAGSGREGSTALMGENLKNEGWFGANQTVTLNQTQATPILISGWSKAEKVGGASDTGYSLYADLTYADGTPLWGQTANFRCGTHDWEQRRFVITPSKAVKSLTLHCLFRGHSGRVWFDDIAVSTLTSTLNLSLYQGALFQPPYSKPVPTTAAPRTLATADGLELAMYDQVVDDVKIDGHSRASSSPAGLMVRDVALNSGFHDLPGGTCSELGLAVNTRTTSQKDHLVVEGEIRDTTGKDRAVTLVFALPLDAVGWQWGRDLLHTETIQNTGDYVNQFGVPCGATSTMSLYPMACVWTGGAGLALGIDMGRPAQYRVGYHAGLRHLYAAYDFGFAPGEGPAAASARFRMVLYRFDPREGFRSAWDKYMRIFPEHFRVRASRQGIWMPFTDVSTVKGWEDFGFRFHEGDNAVPFDDAHDILSFRYTEPMTWWMPMKADTPRTPEDALKTRDRLATEDNAHRRMAQVAQTAAVWDDHNEPAVLFRNEPWCNGAVWSLNPNPFLPVNSSNAPLNGATVYWNDTLREDLYGAKARGHRDGEYLDSLEGYVTADMNYRREHFKHSTVPLVFASDTHQPALFKGLAVYEFTRWLAEDIHRLDKLMFANAVPYRFTFLCPWLDVMGTETDWMREGRWQPVSEDQLCLWRTLSGAKPYLLLMNTDFNRFTFEHVEKYFNRCLLYGFFPSMFSHNASENPYWQNPAWYDRDRPLFKKYLPIIRQVAEAGWQPATIAASSNPGLRMERFGPDASGTFYLTVFNSNTHPQTATISWSANATPSIKDMEALEMVSGASLGEHTNSWVLTIQPESTAVIKLSKPRTTASRAPQAPASLYSRWTNGPSADPGFFPIAVWLQNPSKAAQYRKAGFNLYMGLWKGPTDAQLDTLARAGMRVICEQNATALARLNDPVIAGWMHGDEPDNAQPLPEGKGYGPPIPTATIVADYQRIKAADPSRPVMLNLGQGVAWDNWHGRGVRTRHPEDYPEYVKGCDIASFDVYPVADGSKEISGKLWYVAEGVRRLNGWISQDQMAWNCIECTRISNKERKATPEQVRNEVWMALIHGSKGIIYFVHEWEPRFNESALLSDPAMLAMVTSINQGIHKLAPVLNSPTLSLGATANSENPDLPVAIMLKRHEGKLYLFACALRDGETRVTFTIPKIPAACVAEVLDESRTVAIQNNQFQDRFGPYEVHRYVLDDSEPH